MQSRHAGRVALQLRCCASGGSRESAEPDALASHARDIADEAAIVEGTDTLREKQNERKTRLRRFGKVDVRHEAFTAALKVDF